MGASTKRNRRVESEEWASESESESGSESEEGESECDTGSESESGSESELDLAVDERGRVACELNPELEYDATSTPDAVARARFDSEEEIEVLLEDCVAAHTAKSARRKQGKSGYSSGRTFWVSADGAPRCALEALALETFRRATRTAEAKISVSGAKGKECITAATYDPSNSGAEWWTQVIDDEDEIGWHWDKDYALEGSGVNVHPQLGTVTYFCDNGAPTVVVNRPTDVQCDFGCGDIGVCGAVTECVVSWPEWGKQITFDGKFLHGAPAELARGSARREKRVTFLVNVWLNHKPVTAEPLSADELSAMKLRDVDQATSWMGASIEPRAEPVRALEDDAMYPSRSFDFNFKYAGRKRTLELRLPSFLIRQNDASSAGTAVFNAPQLGELR